MIATLLFMLATPDGGAAAQARATVTIVRAERIDFDRIEAERDEQSPVVQLSWTMVAPDRATGSNGETHILEFH